MRTVVPILVLALLCASRAMAGTYHVFPDGSGSFPSIQAAVDACTDGDEVVLGNGVFVGPSNRNVQIVGKVITVRSEAGPSSCAIDCQGAGRAFVLGAGFVGARIEGLTIRNGSAVNGVEPGKGGAIYCSGGMLSLDRCRFESNTGVIGGGAFYVINSVLHMSASQIIGNLGGMGGGGEIGLADEGDDEDSFVINAGSIRVNPPHWHDTEPVPPGSGGVRGSVGPEAARTPRGVARAGRERIASALGISDTSRASWIRDCLFAGNESTVKYPELYFVLGTNRTLHIRSSILWADDPYVAFELSGGVRCTVDHCDVRGERGGFAVGPVDTLGWGDGNLGLSPQFVNPTPGINNYHLFASSPCIDAGDPAFVPLPGETDLDGNPRVSDGDGNGLGTIDMGAYESASLVGVSGPAPAGTPGRGVVAFPNPFRHGTAVVFTLDRAMHVRVTVHDMTGRTVAALADGWHGAGPCKVEWDGRNGLGTVLAPGLYFVRMEGGGDVLSAKLVLRR